VNKPKLFTHFHKMSFARGHHCVTRVELSTKSGSEVRPAESQAPRQLDVGLRKPAFSQGRLRFRLIYLKRKWVRKHRERIMNGHTQRNHTNRDGKRFWVSCRYSWFGRRCWIWPSPSALVEGNRRIRWCRE